MGDGWAWSARRSSGSLAVRTPENVLGGGRFPKRLLGEPLAAPIPSNGGRWSLPSRAQEKRFVDSPVLRAASDGPGRRRAARGESLWTQAGPAAFAHAAETMPRLVAMAPGEGLTTALPAPSRRVPSAIVPDSAHRPFAPGAGGPTEWAPQGRASGSDSRRSRPVAMTPLPLRTAARDAEADGAHIRNGTRVPMDVSISTRNHPDT